VRTKKEIHKIIKELEKQWLQSPYLRLSQFLSNAISDEDFFYYMEDKDLINKLKIYIKNHGYK